MGLVRVGVRIGFGVWVRLRVGVGGLATSS